MTEQLKSLAEEKVRITFEVLAICLAAVLASAAIGACAAIGYVVYYNLVQWLP